MSYDDTKWNRIPLIDIIVLLASYKEEFTIIYYVLLYIMFELRCLGYHAGLVIYPKFEF